MKKKKKKKINALLSLVEYARPGESRVGVTEGEVDRFWVFDSKTRLVCHWSHVLFREISDLIIFVVCAGEPWVTHWLCATAVTERREPCDFRPR